jgi:hypothetical protein
MVSDKYVIAKVFFDAFPKSTSRLIMVSMGQAPESAYYDVDYVSAVARRLDIAVDERIGKVASGGAAKKRDAESSSSPVSSEAKKSKWYSAPSEGGKDHSAGGYKDRVSKFGKTMAEHMEERTCRRCNGHYGKGHRCNTAVRSGSGPNDAKVLRMMSRRNHMKARITAALDSELGRQMIEEKKGASSGSLVAGAVVSGDAKPEAIMTVSSSSVVPAPTVDSDIEMSESDMHSVGDEADLKMRAEATLVNGMASVAVDDADLLMNLSAQACKFDAVFSAPPTMRSNYICVPLVVQNVVCFGIVDTGSTFSCITNEFFESLGGRSHAGFRANLDNSVVQMAHEVSTVPRVGSVELSLEYNRLNKIHMFEVFTFYSEENVHVLLGMDILSKLGIGISGLVSRHGFQASPRLPDPIDDSIKPNADPFGSDAARAPFVKLLNELLVENSQIDMKNTQCNLPDSIIRLDTKPGCYAWRAQYPLPEAYRDAVNKQIQVWLDEGVIEKSASHTRFNHPLLVVKKKDADGNYDMSKPRVVLDVRKLNSILEVDDKQQLPLISTIHQNIGTKTIHTHYGATDVLIPHRSALLRTLIIF